MDTTHVQWLQFFHATKGLGTSFVNVFPRTLSDDTAKLPNLGQHWSHHCAKSIFGLSRIERWSNSKTPKENKSNTSNQNYGEYIYLRTHGVLITQCLLVLILFRVLSLVVLLSFSPLLANIQGWQANRRHLWLPSRLHAEADMDCFVYIKVSAPTSDSFTWFSSKLDSAFLFPRSEVLTQYSQMPS